MVFDNEPSHDTASESSSTIEDVTALRKEIVAASRNLVALLRESAQLGNTTADRKRRHELSEEVKMQTEVCNTLKAMLDCQLDTRQLQHEVSTTSTSPANSTTSSRKVVYYVCGKEDHYANSCPHKKTVVTSSKPVVKFATIVSAERANDNAYVMVRDISRRNKLDPRFEGPFKVIGKSNNTYTLQDNSGALLPRNYPPSALKLISTDPVFTSESYVVDAILNHRATKNGFEYLVRWKNYSKQHDSWEPASNFDDETTIVNYRKRRKQPAANTSSAGRE